MDEAEPTVEDVIAAAVQLCSYCSLRAAGFLGAHQAYPHFTTSDALHLVQSLTRSCCTVWRGREPAHWSAGIDVQPVVAAPPRGVE